MKPQVSVTVVDDGRVILRDDQARILELIDQTGTLAAAASRLGLSYRRAWGQIREVETNSGVRIVESVVGGARGGSSRLTPAAIDLLGRYRRFRRAVDSYAEQEFARCFDGA